MLDLVTGMTVFDVFLHCALPATAFILIVGGAR